MGIVEKVSILRYLVFKLKLKYMFSLTYLCTQFLFFFGKFHLFHALVIHMYLTNLLKLLIHYINPSI